MLLYMNSDCHFALNILLKDMRYSQFNILSVSTSACNGVPTFSSAKQESATALKKRVCLLVYRITFGCSLNLSYHSSKWYSRYVLCSSKHLYVSSPTGAQPGAVRIPPQSHPVQVLPRTWRIRSDSEGSLMVTSRDPRRKSE